MSDHLYYCEQLRPAKRTWEPEPKSASIPFYAMFDIDRVNTWPMAVKKLGRPRKQERSED